MHNDPVTRELLETAAAGDTALLEQLWQRVRAGEPAAYAAGMLMFRGRRFLMDRRAYITDPEASFQIDVVLQQGREVQRELGRPPQLLEFGVGAGTLGISIKHEQPDWELIGIDIDADALALAGENAKLHGFAIELLESNYLDGWPTGRAAPDLVFGDPPWGDAEDLYDSERDEAYYLQMPRLSAFPLGGGRTTIHDELIRRFVASGWPSRLVLNYGILPPEVIAASAAPLSSWKLVHPRPDISVLIAKG